jgi:hypothetical protein
VSIFDKALAAIGYAPMARELATEVLKSPWAGSDDLTKWTFEDLYGIDLTGVVVNRSAAMKIATVAKARNVVATTVGRLPLYNEKAGRRAPAQMPLLAQPERGVPLSTTLTWTVDALLFHPCTWWHVLERDTYGWPVWVEWIDRSRAELDSAGKLVKIDRRTVLPEDVIRFDSPLGTGLLDIARETLARATKLNRTAANAEENPVPSIDLHDEDATANLGTDEIEKLVKQWRDARTKGSVAYTPKRITAKPLGVQPEQLLIDGRKQIQLELTRHLNVPAWVLDVELGGSSLTYNNRQSRNAELIDLALAPYMTAIVDRLSMADVTPRGWRVKFDTDDLTKPDQQTRFTTYKTGVDGNFVTTEQIAEWEGWTTTPAGVAS